MERARPSRLPLRSGGSARNRRVTKEAKPKAKAKTRAAAKAKAPAKSSERRRISDPVAPPPRRPLGDGKEILAVVLLAASAIFGLALGSYDASTGNNLIGKAGTFIAQHLFEVFGLGAFVLPLAFFFAFLGLIRPEGKRIGLVSALGYLAILVGASMLCDLLAPSLRWFGARPGGSLGGAAADGMAQIFSVVGSVILVTAGVATALVIATGLKVSRISLFLGKTAKAAGRWTATFVQTQIDQHRAEREAQLAEEEAEREAEEALAAAAFDAAIEQAEEEATPPRRKGKRREEEIEADLDGRVKIDPEPARPVVVAPPAAKAAKAQAEQQPSPLAETAEETTEGEPSAPALPPDPVWAGGSLPTGTTSSAAAPANPAVEPESQPEPEFEVQPQITMPPAAVALKEEEPAEEEAPLPELSEAAKQALVKAGVLPAGPVIELPKAPPKPKKTDSPFDLIASEDGFSLPPLSLLERHSEDAQPKIDEAMLHNTADRLRQKLADFGIQGQVERIRPGPVVTMYEFAPAPGVKISKISGLSDDLAMALEAMRVRIVAPIPGRGVVGIEVPNKKRETVYLGDILEQDAFRKSKSRLTMAIGKDIEGMPFVADLAKMPHLLMSGTTGSGKSVSVNSMIMSLLFKATPEEVRFIMVDPKMLELSIYEGIPHLLLPVVTEPRKAALALRWAVDEMERRYALLAENGVRDLAGFNAVMAKKIEERAKKDAEAAEAREKAAAKEETAAAKRKLRIVEVAEGETEEEALARVEAEESARVALEPKPEDEVEPELPDDALDPVEAFLEKKHEEELEPKKLPYLVIIIDELADLMMVASKEVETYIARIAQKARAAGIHLMVATQRPSVDVVTGLIKANFPSRISFALRSRIDSMTILDTPGAEKLLGMGDMLILPPTSAHLQRVHGPLVTEREIKQVVDFLKEQGSPVYDESILKEPDADAEGGGDEDDLSDELFDQAIAIVSEMKSVSISMLQRKMRIGYNRSARMIERMERDGIVGPADGARPREVLIRGIGEMPGA